MRKSLQTPGLVHIAVKAGNTVVEGVSIIKTYRKRWIKGAVLCGAVITAVYMLIVTLRLSLMPYAAGQHTAQSTNTAAPADAQAEQEQMQFVVKEYNGQVCVFHRDYSDIPAVMTPVSVQSLGSYDRELVEKGIYLPSREDVLKFLEDFLS